MHQCGFFHDNIKHKHLLGGWVHYFKDHCSLQWILVWWDPDEHNEQPHFYLQLPIHSFSIGSLYSTLQSKKTLLFVVLKIKLHKYSLLFSVLPFCSPPENQVTDIGWILEQKSYNTNYYKYNKTWQTSWNLLECSKCFRFPWVKRNRQGLQTTTIKYIDFFCEIFPKDCCQKQNKQTKKDFWMTEMCSWLQSFSRIEQEQSALTALGSKSIKHYILQISKLVTLMVMNGL